MIEALGGEPKVAAAVGGELHRIVRNVGPQSTRCGGQAPGVSYAKGDAMTREQKYLSFRAMHERPGLFVMPNPWNAGTARILTAMGFEALATTSAEKPLTRAVATAR